MRSRLCGFVQGVSKLSKKGTDRSNLFLGLLRPKGKGEGSRV